MRRIAIICLTFLGILSATVTSAQDIRRADPPITTIEINGYEPLPAGIPDEVYYGGLGGGGDSAMLAPEGIYWESTPGAMAIAESAFFDACGYSSSTPPIVTLTAPSGAQTQIPVEFSDYGENCFYTYLEWQYGVELGIYNITFDHADGSLSHTFGYDYAICWLKYQQYQLDTGNQVDWLMGFEPNEQLTLLFYIESVANDGIPKFVASRNVRANEDGVVMVDIELGLTAPFSESELYYFTTGVGRIVYPLDLGSDVTPFTDMGYTLPAEFIAPPSTYPHNQTMGIGFLNTDTRGIPCDGEFSRFVQVYPRPAGVGSLPIYANINDTTVIGSLPAGTVAEIIETEAALTNRRTVTWKYLQTEDGTAGWTPSIDLVNLLPYAAPGVRAEVQPIGRETSTENYFTAVSPPLFSLPGGQIIGEITPGTEVTLLEYTTIDDLGWWKVSFAGSSTVGWMYEYDPRTHFGGFEPLGWQADESASVLSTPTPLASVPVTCPGSPPSRLEIGGTGRVVPGDPNRLRAAPESGEVLGNIPGNQLFIIIDGPVCGPVNGLAWWRVNYSGAVGWTAEGQGSTYWLEMAN